MTGSVVGIIVLAGVVVFLAKLALRRAGRTVVKLNITYPPAPPPAVVYPPAIPPQPFDATAHDFGAGAEHSRPMRPADFDNGRPWGRGERRGDDGDAFDELVHDFYDS